MNWTWTKVAGKARELPWRTILTTAALLLAVAAVASAGPIQQGVKKGMDESSEVSKYIIGGFGGLIAALGLGSVAYKVVKKEDDWGLSLAATIVGLAIAGVAAVV